MTWQPFGSQPGVRWLFGARARCRWKTRLSTARHRVKVGRNREMTCEVEAAPAVPVGGVEVLVRAVEIGDVLLHPRPRLV